MYVRKREENKKWNELKPMTFTTTPLRANIVLTNEINAVHNDIWIAVDGNKSIFHCDEYTKKALDSLYRSLHQMKERGEF